jgi:hypothetical protein
LRSVDPGKQSNKFVSRTLIRINASRGGIANLPVVFTGRPRGWRSVQSGSPGCPTGALFSYLGGGRTRSGLLIFRKDQPTFLNYQKR